MGHVWFPTKDKHGNQQRQHWREAIMIHNYKTMWLAHGSQVINHMTKNKGKEETCLAGWISYTQARGKG
jgi:hypothetical protein